MKKRNKGSKNSNIKRVDNHIEFLRNRVRFSCKLSEIMMHEPITSLDCMGVFFADQMRKNLH